MKRQKAEKKGIGRRHMQKEVGIGRRQRNGQILRYLGDNTPAAHISIISQTVITECFTCKYSYVFFFISVDRIDIAIISKEQDELNVLGEHRKLYQLLKTTRKLKAKSELALSVLSNFISLKHAISPIPIIKKMRDLRSYRITN